MATVLAPYHDAFVECREVDHSDYLGMLRSCLLLCDHNVLCRLVTNKPRVLQDLIIAVQFVSG